MQLFSRRDFQYLYDNCFTENDRGHVGLARFLCITDEGVFYDACLVEGGAALKFLRWKPVHELTGPNKPPSSGPALPFPFTASQLTAFMLWGWGNYFQDAFGRLDSGPNEFVLNGEHEDGADAYEALRQAYDIFQDAQRVVGELDHDQPQRAHELITKYDEEHSRALEREKVMEPDISRTDYRLRRRRARAPIAPLKLQADDARSQADAALKAWRNAMVRQLLQPQQTETQPQVGSGVKAPGSEPDWHFMATPTELCAAFGAFTGMNKNWFNNLKDTPKLKAARFGPGQGGRNKREPLFHVYDVLMWLIDVKRRKGKTMTVETGWRMLKAHFPRVYEAYELNAPGTD